MDDDDAIDPALILSLSGAPLWLVLLCLISGVLFYNHVKTEERHRCEQQNGVYTHVGKQWLCIRRGESPFIDVRD